MEIENAKLLLVDDDAAAILALRGMLSDCRHLRFANSGTAALRAARAMVPDLVVLDANMPGMGGLDVVAAMRRDPALAHVPIIMATAHSAEDAELVAIERGVSDFITKPVAPEKLRARIKARLRDRAGDTVPADLDGARQGRPALLIVDDDVAAVQTLGSMLQDMGQVHFVTSGAEALERARALVPDLMLLDSRMPGVDGFEVCSAMQADETLRNVPIVFVTRYDGVPDETRALDLGAADFISKPYTASVLRARVRNLLEQKARNDAQLRAESERWRQLADERVAEIVRTASDAILSCDAKSRVILANAAAARMFGRPGEQIVGQPLDALLPQAEALVAEARRSAQRLDVARPDGSHVTAEVTASQAAEGRRAVVTLVLRDVGDRERLEAEQRARAAAEARNQTKTRMIGVIAHEMGNPLNALLGFTSLLQADTTTRLAPRHATWVGHMDGAARSLKRLLDDLIEFARNDSGKLQLTLRPVDLHDSVDGVLRRLAPLAQPEAIELLGPEAADAPVLVQADPQRLAQCLVNLVSNAIKYNRRRGHVRVTIGADGDRASVSVRDDGLGMDEQQLAALYEPFNRLGRERGDTPGTGLGLVITRQLVQAMHGELRVESRAGEGSCFTLLLPRA